MGTLVYSMQVSADGFIEDRNGEIGFAEPASDVHRAANQDAREAAAFLYGRRMFAVMDDFWTTAASVRTSPRSRPSSLPPTSPPRGTSSPTRSTRCRTG